LPYGIALRPTQAFESLKNYIWRGSKLNFKFGIKGYSIGIEIDGKKVYGTLQVPQSMIGNRNSVDISLIESDDLPLWLRSTVELLTVDGLLYTFKAYGLSEIRFNKVINCSRIIDESGKIVDCSWIKNKNMSVCQFTHFGTLRLEIEL
jgi:hypothetical protein